MKHAPRAVFSEAMTRLRSFRMKLGLICDVNGSISFTNYRSLIPLSSLMEAYISVLMVLTSIAELITFILDMKKIFISLKL